MGYNNLGKVSAAPTRSIYCGLRGRLNKPRWSKIYRTTVGVLVGWMKNLEVYTLYLFDAASAVFSAVNSTHLFDVHSTVEWWYQKIIIIFESKGRASSVVFLHSLKLVRSKNTSPSITGSCCATNFQSICKTWFFRIPMVEVFVFLVVVLRTISHNHASTYPNTNGTMAKIECWTKRFFSATGVYAIETYFLKNVKNILIHLTSL